MQRKVLVKVENVWKHYCRDLRLSILYGVQDIAKELVGLTSAADNLRRSEFWALNDVSFEVKEGEAIGIMGHNGAGKTTILKLASGLIKPTKGKITTNGSVRALIALGVGFNPLLTGRENIWIASAIQGYSRREIKERFDEIVAFSELEEFIDSPVQSYSSGMMARLAFSVAINTQPDILLVDEVLAVGDLNFAIKCYRKISEFRNKNGSIIMVSHSPYAIRTNCDRAIWIEGGKIQKVGQANEICDAYEQFVARSDTTQGEKRHIDDSIEIMDIVYPNVIRNGDPFVLELKLKATRAIESPIIAISIFNVSGQNVLSNISKADKVNLEIGKGLTMIRVKYDHIFLSRGVYYLSLVVAEKHMNNQLAAWINSHRFEVQTQPDDYGAGMFRLQPIWEINHEP